MLRFVLALTRPQKRAILLGLDMLLVPFAIVLTGMLQIEANAGGDTLLANIQIAIPLMVVAGILASQLGIPKIQLNAYENTAIGKTAVFTIFLTISAFIISRLTAPFLPVGYFVIFGLIFFILSVSSRIAMQQFLLALYRRNQDRSRVLIYGAGTTGMQLASALKTHETIQPIAFIDDNFALQGVFVAGLPVLSPVRISDIITEKKIDRVLLAMPSVSLPQQSQIVRQLEALGLEVQSLPSFAQLAGKEALVDQLATVSPGRLLGRAQVQHDNILIAEHYEGRSVLVTGAGGSIGSELCRQILACNPSHLIMVDHSELALYSIDMEMKALAEGTKTKIHSVLGSVCNQVLVQTTLETHNVDVVIHAAAYKHVPLVEANMLTGLSNNVLGTAIMAKAAKTAKVKRFILVSSDKAVRPTNIMGASKRLAELIVQDQAARTDETIYSMVRFGNVLGSSGSVIPLFQNQIARGGPVTLTHSEVTRYFMTIQEATRLVLMAGSFAKGGEVFVLDMGQPVNIGSLAKKVIEAQGYTVKNDENPDGDIEITITGLRPGEKLHEELLIGEGNRTTAHELIFCAHETCLSEIEVATAVKSLQEATRTGNEALAVDTVRRWVDGYTPRGHQAV